MQHPPYTTAPGNRCSEKDYESLITQRFIFSSQEPTHLFAGTLNGSTGWWIFGITWGLALIGITLKLFFTGRYEIISTLMYVFMGWVIVFAIEPLINNFSTQGIAWLVAGGVAYTLGAIMYGIKIMKYNHATFHIFVLIGSAAHFVSVFFYVLPG